MMRRGSIGLAGTYQNIEHHAKRLKPLVDVLAATMPALPFEEWRQGHNVHLLITKDRRQFVLRPFSQARQGYVGISLYARFSKSTEMLLFTLYHDARNGLSILAFLNLLNACAEIRPEHVNLSLAEVSEVAAAGNVSQIKQGVTQEIPID